MIKSTPPILPAPPAPLPTLTYAQSAALARKWARAHGFYGKPGGWIYGPSGRPIAQGWVGLYLKLKRRIHDETSHV